MNDESSEEEIDDINYKGIYFGNAEDKKEHDPITGAHFMFGDLCNWLTVIKVERNKSKFLIQEISATIANPYESSSKLESQVIDSKTTKNSRNKNPMLVKLNTNESWDIKNFKTDYKMPETTFSLWRWKKPNIQNLNKYYA